MYGYLIITAQFYIPTFNIVNYKIIYLSKIKPEFCAIEIILVEFGPCFCCCQCIAEIYSHPPETLKKLKGSFSVKCTEELLKTSLRETTNKEITKI